MRTSLGLLFAATVVAGLFPTPRLAAQQSPVRPVVTPAEEAPSETANLRRLVNEEAVHRDRSARIARLRTLAEQSGRRDRVAELDRLARVENERFDSRTQVTRRRMSPNAQREADEVLRKGGVVRLRREATQNQGQGVQRSGNRGATRSETAPARRQAAPPTRRPSTGTAPRSSSGSGTSGTRSSGGRSPR